MNKSGFFLGRCITAEKDKEVKKDLHMLFYYTHGTKVTKSTYEHNCALCVSLCSLCSNLFPKSYTNLKTRFQKLIFSCEKCIPCNRFTGPGRMFCRLQDLYYCFIISRSGKIIVFHFYFSPYQIGKINKGIIPVSR